MVISYSGNQYLHFSFKNNKKTLGEGGNNLTGDAKIAETLNSFLGNILHTLHTETNESIFCDTEDKTDPLLHKIKNITIILAF